mmetsp:Transcript_1317/g.2294  ORF Transcript_1317/g.2294 Transcript_1317/m.2294 type:complete len:203 (+) Transcript_1317:559-1167(+)
MPPSVKVYFRCARHRIFLAQDTTSFIRALRNRESNWLGQFPWSCSSLHVWPSWTMSPSLSFSTWICESSVPSVTRLFHSLSPASIGSATEEGLNKESKEVCVSNLSNNDCIDLFASTSPNIDSNDERVSNSDSGSEFESFRKYSAPRGESIAASENEGEYFDSVATMNLNCGANCFFSAPMLSMKLKISGHKLSTSFVSEVT